MSIKPDRKTANESDKEAILSDDESQSALESGKLDKQKEINGPRGLEPTRYGDWESKGRCVDF